MNNYNISLKLHTLARCTIISDDVMTAKFNLDDVSFEHWNYHPTTGCQTDAWLLSGKITAKNFKEADRKFVKKLDKIIPKISFISQCYAEYMGQSFLIHKEGSNDAYIQYSRGRKGVGIHFDNQSLKALNFLADTNEIPEKFFYYWNDMVNTTGYSAKLLLLFAAMDSLAPESKKRKEKREEVLGKELADKLFGEKQKGARHRLSHGEYLSEEVDKKNDYLTQAYGKIIDYFNKKIFHEELVKEVVNPQRNPHGNRDGYKIFIRKKANAGDFDFKRIIDECDQYGFENGTKDFLTLGKEEIKNY